MSFKDWQDTANVAPLTLPIRDRDGNRREYVIPPLGYLDAIQLREEGERWRNLARIRADQRRIAAGEPPELDAAERERIEQNPPQLDNEAFLRLMLGGALQQMRDDNVPEVAIVHAASVAYTDEMAGREAAEKLWNEGPDPKALAEAINALSLDGSTTSPSTPPPARTSSTKPRASTASTRSRKTRAAKSTGTTSSRTRS